MLLEILTPLGKTYSQEVQAVQLPGVDGFFEILDGHSPMITLLGKGKVKIYPKGVALGSKDAITDYTVNKGGFMQVKNNHVIVLAEEILKN